MILIRSAYQYHLGRCKAAILSFSVVSVILVASVRGFLFPRTYSEHCFDADLVEVSDLDAAQLCAQERRARAAAKKTASEQEFPARALLYPAKFCRKQLGVNIARGNYPTRRGKVEAAIHSSVVGNGLFSEERGLIADALQEEVGLWKMGGYDGRSRVVVEALAEKILTSSTEGSKFPNVVARGSERTVGLPPHDSRVRTEFEEVVVHPSPQVWNEVAERRGVLTRVNNTSLRPAASVVLSPGAGADPDHHLYHTTPEQVLFSHFKFYPLFHDKPHGKLHHDLIKHFRFRSAKNETALELGCAGGHTTRVLASLFKSVICLEKRASFARDIPNYPNVIKLVVDLYQENWGLMLGAAGPVHVVFFDALHDYSGLLMDVGNVLAKVVCCVHTVVFHDFTYAGVMRAVKDAGVVDYFGARWKLLGGASNGLFAGWREDGASNGLFAGWREDVGEGRSSSEEGSGGGSAGGLDEWCGG